MDCAEVSQIRGQARLLIGNTTSVVVAFKFAVSPWGSMFLERDTADRLSTIGDNKMSATGIDCRGFARVRMEVVTATATADSLALFDLYGYSDVPIVGDLRSMGQPPGIPDTGGAAGGGASCPVPETLIQARGDGYSVEAGSLEIGDTIWTTDELCRHPGSYTVSGVKPDRARCMRLILEDGKVLVASHNHRVLTKTGWQPIDSLGPGGMVYGYPPARVEAVEPVGLREVVKITVAEAATYVSNGICSHNAKGGGPP
jgi:hypothetical protein